MAQAVAPEAESGSAGFQEIFTRPSLIILVALLLGSTTINYIDRQVLSVLAPELKAEFGLSDPQYAGILNAFLISYAFSYSFAGWVIDRLGFSRGLTLAILWWSTAGALTSLARGPMSLGFFRALLAVGEGGGWPAFAKATAMWVPPRARTLVIGICNGGSSLGAVIAPPLVAFVTLQWGWRSAFVVAGSFGFIWVVFFRAFLKKHPQMQATDRGLKPKEEGGIHISWLSLIRYRQTWAVFFMRFFADTLWVFYAFWIPDFLSRERGLDLAAIGAVAWIPFLVAGLGNVAGGYLALRLERAGWSVNKTRKTMLLIATIMSPIGIAAVFAESVFWTIGFISIAIFFWVFWAITVHTLPGDYFPPQAVASVFGFAGTGSTLGSVVSTWATGQVLYLTDSYVPVFVGMGLLMPVAYVVGSTLMGRVEPIRFPEAAAPAR